MAKPIIIFINQMDCLVFFSNFHFYVLATNQTILTDKMQLLSTAKTYLMILIVINNGVAPKFECSCYLALEGSYLDDYAKLLNSIKRRNYMIFGLR